MVVYGQSRRLGDARGHDARIARDVEQPSRRVVVVTDEVQVTIVRALDAVATHRKSLGVDADQLTERRERGTVAGGENDDVEWQLGGRPAIGEHRSTLRQSIDSTAYANEPSTNGVDKVKANEGDRIERSVCGSRQHRRPSSLLDDAADETDYLLSCLTRQLADVAGEILHRNAEDLARHDVRPRPHRDGDIGHVCVGVTHPCELARDLAAGIADADDENALPEECVRYTVVDRMQQLTPTALELVGSRYDGNARIRDDTGRHDHNAALDLRGPSRRGGEYAPVSLLAR